MPLKLVDNTNLITGQTTLLNNASPVSFSIWVRLDRYGSWADDGMGRMLGCGDLAHSNLMVHDTIQGRWVLNSGGSTTSDYFGTPALVHGVDYHVAFTVADGEQKLYLNGALVVSHDASGVDGWSSDTNGHPFEVSCPDGVTVTVQEPVVWAGYKLTASDVQSLRDGASPTTISPSNIKWHLTLAGTGGSAAAVGDSGLACLSGSGLNISVIQKYNTSGTPPAIQPVYESI